MITESAAEIEDQRVVARRLFDAMCAQFPDKYIALIQPRASEINRPKLWRHRRTLMTLQPRDHVDCDAVALGEGSQRLAHSPSNFSIRVPIL
jgi:hypothetical protein